MKLRAIWIGVLYLALAACGGTQTVAPIKLPAGQYTPLGGVQKSNNPTASEFVGLRAAENGTLERPALVEFYADY